MKVYISGKIGENTISEKTRAKFDAVEEKLIELGYEVFNPTSGRWQQVLEGAYGRLAAENWNTRHTFYSYVLQRDIKKVGECDAICMLEDWPESPGALAELAYAAACGKKTYLWTDALQRMDLCHWSKIIRSMF